MLAVSLGPYSRFAEWCDQILLAEARFAFGSAEYHTAATAAQLITTLAASRAQCHVVACRVIEWDLLQALLAAGCPLLVPLDAAKSCVLQQAHDFNTSIAETARQVASILSACSEVMEKPEALILRSSAKPDALQIASEINEHFRFGLGAEQIDEIARSLDPGRLDERHLIDLQNISPSEKRLLDGAVSPYDDVSRPGKLNWERGLFYLLEDGLAEPAARAIDLTGRPRMLFYGPYIAIPAGSWNAEIFVGVSQDGLGTPISIELYERGGGELARARIVPDKAGVCRVDLAVKQSNSASPLELRIRLESSAFDGKIAIGYVQLNSVAANGEMSPANWDFSERDDA